MLLLSCLKSLQPFFHLGLGLKPQQAPPDSFSVSDAIQGWEDLATSSPVAFRESLFEATGPFLQKEASWKVVWMSEALMAALAERGRLEALSIHLSPNISRKLQEPSFKPTVWSNIVVFQMKLLG